MNLLISAASLPAMHVGISNLWVFKVKFLNNSI